MTKRLVTFRADPELVDSFDAWCHDSRLTRTAALLAFMAAPNLTAGDDTQYATRDKPRSAGSASARGARSPSPSAKREVVPNFKKGT
jgi:hypothetical protein